MIRGQTTDPVGTYDGFTVRATDGEGCTAVSAPFSVTVVAPTSLKPLEEVALSYRWTVGVPFDFALPRPSNAFGDVSYLYKCLL